MLCELLVKCPIFLLFFHVFFLFFPIFRVPIVLSLCAA